MRMICEALHDLVLFVQFKKREKHDEGVLPLVKLQAETYNFTKSKTPPWMYKWYQITQRISP